MVPWALRLTNAQMLFKNSSDTAITHPISKGTQASVPQNDIKESIVTKSKWPQALVCSFSRKRVPLRYSSCIKAKFVS